VVASKPRRILLPLALGTRSSHECPSPPAVARAEKACAPDLPTIGELAGSAPDLSTLVAAVKAANLTDVLSLPGPIDVFAPTNDAFGALLASLNISAETLLAETALLTNVLQYHVVVDGAVCSGDLSGAVETAQGDALTVDGSTVTDANGNAANIVGAIDAGNGVVYVINSVLLPPANDSPAVRAPVAEGAFAEAIHNAFDLDGNGLVTEAESVEFLADAESRGIPVPPAEMVAAMRAGDKNGDGLDLNERIAVLRGWHNEMDADGNGLVTEAELRAFDESQGRQLDDQRVAAFLAADKNEDGLDVDEYFEYVCNIPILRARCKGYE